MSDYSIEIKDLKKTYAGPFEALKGISLTVKKGDFFGLLGPNGAGKSTTISIICQLVTKTSGHVTICGHSIDDEPTKAKEKIGVVPQEFNFNIFEPCYQIVVNQAGYYGVPRKEALIRAKELFKQLDLESKWSTPAGRLSGGLKRRLMIARALVHNPEVLILDEPTAGVDISLRRSMWSFLKEKNKQGLTIILTTHYLEEAESLCKHLAIIDKGMIIKNEPIDVLLDSLKVETVLLYCKHIPSLPEIDGIKAVQSSPNILEVQLTESQHLTSTLEKLSSQGIIVNRIQNKANRLEELFVGLVGDA